MKKHIALLLALVLAALLPCAALAQSAMDGVYTATCHGFYSDFFVTVTIRNGAIAAITHEGSTETPELGGKAIELMSQRMIAENTSGVDAVSGATVTSAVFRVAVNDCLAQAGAPEGMLAKPQEPAVEASTLETGVLVIGAGAAGLSAAIAA